MEVIMDMEKLHLDLVARDTRITLVQLEAAMATLQLRTSGPRDFKALVSVLPEAMHMGRMVDKQTDTLKEKKAMEQQVVDVEAMQRTKATKTRHLAVKVDGTGAQMTLTHCQTSKTPCLQEKDRRQLIEGKTSKLTDTEQDKAAEETTDSQEVNNHSASHKPDPRVATGDD